MENGQKNGKNDLSMISSLFHRVKISILFRISDLGLTWRDFPVTLYCRCNTLEVKAIELGPFKPGLGQGFGPEISNFKATGLDLTAKT